MQWLLWSLASAASVLEVFWIHDTVTFPQTPIRDLAKYRKPDGSMQADIVTVSNGFLQTDRVGNAYVNVSTLNIEPDDVAFLKKEGAAVLLSIVGSASGGWGCMSEDQSERFAWYLKTTLMPQWGFDGFDADVEYHKCNATNKQLVQTLRIVRRVLGPDVILKKDLADDADVIALIHDVIDFGSTMGYEASASWLIGTFNRYRALGLRSDQISLGVSPGPAQQNFISVAAMLDTCAQLRLLSPNITRMSLFSFNQDLADFFLWPQHTHPPPNALDHSYQTWLSWCLHG